MCGESTFSRIENLSHSQSASRDRAQLEYLPVDGDTGICRGQLYRAREENSGKSDIMESVGNGRLPLFPCWAPFRLPTGQLKTHPRYWWDKCGWERPFAVN